MSWVSLSDTNHVHYVEMGSGTPLVFISGWGGEAANWLQDMQFFQTQFRCITIDNPGLADQPLPKGPFSIRDMADRIVCALRALGIDRAHILGHSMGGAIAQQVALHYPDLVDRLVLCGTFAQLDNRSYRVLSSCGELMQSCEPEVAVRMVYWLIFGASFYESQIKTIDTLLAMTYKNLVPHGVFEYQTEACLKHDTSSSLATIQSPTLVTHGTDDILIGSHLGKAVADMIPNATFYTLDGAGHSHLWEQPQAWRERVLRFLLGDV